MYIQRHVLIITKEMRTFSKSRHIDCLSKYIRMSEIHIYAKTFSFLLPATKSLNRAGIKINIAAIFGYASDLFCEERRTRLEFWTRRTTKNFGN